MKLRPLEYRFRRIFFGVFVCTLIGVSLFSAFGKYIELRDSYTERMRSQVLVAQELIRDFIFKYDKYLLEISKHCPAESTLQVKEYLHKKIHFHETGDLYYVLDKEQKIFSISEQYSSYNGMRLSHNRFLQSAERISRVHQSIFSNKSVVSIKYPMSCSMTLVIERSIDNVIKSMGFFDKGRMFANQTLFVLTTEGTVAYHSDARLMKSRHNLGFEMVEWNPPAIGDLFSYQLQGEKFFAYKEQFSIPKGWTIYFSVPASLFFDPIKKSVFLYLAVVLVFVVIIFMVLQSMFSHYFSLPVNRIVEALDSYDVTKKAQAVPSESAYGVEEFAHIIDSINSMATEVRQSNQQLLRSDEQIRLLLNSTAEAIYGLDVNGLCTFCNTAFLSMMGYEKESDILGREMHMLIHHSHPDGSPYPAEECMAHRGFLEGERNQVNNEVFWRVDGTSIPVEYWSYPIHLDEKVIGAVVTFIDITQRKQVEERLEAEKEQLAVTLRSIGDAVITTDIKGRVVLVNRVAEELTGWSQAEAKGQPLPDVFRIIDEQSREPLPNPVNTIMQSGKVIELATHTTLVSRNGTERSIADSGAPIHDRQSQIIGVVLVFRDVTEHNKLQEEFLKAKKIESVGVLAGGIAHDFNNLLMAILGYINLAEELAQSDEQKELLVKAEKASLRAKGLTQQLLTFAMGGEPVTETASIAEVIQESADFVLHGSNVAIDFIIPEDIRLVTIDKGQISQVIQNIVLNANNAMPSGGNITISCKNTTIGEGNKLTLSPGNYVQISIADTGVGIPAAHLEKIFDPYFTTNESGHGLGLAVTGSIITKHNGYIGVESKVGKGTTFTIFLPASSDQETTPPARDKTTDSGTGTVMVMDDDKMLQDVASMMLSHLGYKVILSEDGGEMLEKYKQAAQTGNPVDLVIMDLTIPGGMGGKKAMGKLLEIDPDATVIVASGYSNDPIMANFQDYGFKGALSKPFQLDELARAVNELLAKN